MSKPKRKRVRRVVLREDVTVGWWNVGHHADGLVRSSGGSLGRAVRGRLVLEVSEPRVSRGRKR